MTELLKHQILSFVAAHLDKIEEWPTRGAPGLTSERVLQRDWATLSTLHKAFLAVTQEPIGKTTFGRLFEQATGVSALNRARGKTYPYTHRK